MSEGPRRVGKLLHFWSTSSSHEVPVNLSISDREFCTHPPRLLGEAVSRREDVCVVRRLQVRVL